LRLQSAADHQGGLGHAVGRQPRLRIEAARGEGVGKRAQGFLADRLGAVEGHPQAAQIERGALLFGDLARAQFVGEVGRAGDVGPEIVDRLEPAVRIEQEGGRTHQHARVAAVQRRQDRADQAEVMVRRQPEHRQVVRAGQHPLVDQLEILEQVAVADHDALGRAGRAGRILQKGQAVFGQARVAPVVAGLGGVDQQPARHRQLFTARLHRGDALQVGPGGDGGAGLGVVEDRLQARQLARAGGRIGRHRHRAGVQATIKRAQIIDAGLAQQHHRLSRRPAPPLQAGADNARPRVQFGVADARLRLGAIVEEDIGRVIRRQTRALREHLNETLGIGYVRHR
jgi:hypothetical protein